MELTLSIFLSSALASILPSTGPRQSLDVQIPVLPSLVVSGGRSMLAFEVHATNFSSEPLTMQAMRIVDANSSRAIATYAGEALAARLKIVGAAGAPTDKTLGAGSRAIAYVELDFAPGKGTDALGVEIDCSSPDGRRFTIRTGGERVDRAPIPTLGPPLKTGTWVAVHDPSWERGHRRVTYTLGGRTRIPGRYAIDWVGVDDEGRTSKGDPDSPSDAIGYGAVVLAGAEAVVAAVHDDMDEASSILQTPSQPLGRGSGNYVVLRLAANRFAFYEHLRPGSISVRAGDHVKVGQAIGAVGFSGDTTGPHLHLHVANCASPLECEGLPFTIRGVTELGTYLPLSDLGLKRWNAKGARGRIAPEWLAYNVVVAFP